MTTIYLGGPINGTTDEEASGWRDQFIKEMGDHFTFKDPMVRDYRGREDECVDEIVELDKQDIEESDVFLAYCWQVSWGTAMEIYYAWLCVNVRVSILVVPEGMRISPWLRYHSSYIVSSLKEAQDLIRELA